MNRLVLATLLAALYLVGTACPSAAEAQMVTAQNPQSIRALLDRWGYQPSQINYDRNIPTMTFTIDEIYTGAGFGGCTNGRNCVYLVLINTFSDVSNPPWEWLNTQNSDLDAVTLTRNPQGLLTVRASIALGAQGIPESVFRSQLQEWVNSNQDIAQRAIDAHLVTPEPAAGPSA